MKRANLEWAPRRRGMGRWLSHPPIRPFFEPRPGRPPSTGRFVDAARGSDANPGSRSRPWKTIGHGVGRVKAGETLWLRGGIYHENLYVARQGRVGAAITIRGHPGETAVVDGGLREFLDRPSRAWVPVAGPTPGLFRSTRAYPGERIMLGLFGDSMVGLTTYQHREDLMEPRRVHFVTEAGKPMPLPAYLGPGVWYDPKSGHIYARLSRTDHDFDQPGAADYRGVEDPRKVPLVLAPYRSLPIFLDGARHVRIQDLVVRGCGENSIVLHACEHVEFENVVVYCGTYGLRARSSGPVRFRNSALYGSVSPWFTAGMLGLRAYAPPRDPRNAAPPKGWIQNRDVARLNTHVLVALEGRMEDQVDYVIPGNHHWEFSHCDFTDSLDGIHLGGECIRFHHNRVDRCLDDSLYLTPLTPQYLDHARVYQNLFTRCMITFGVGGVSEPGNSPIHIYRNIVDMRGKGMFSHGKFLVMIPFVQHFRSLAASNWGKLFIYQNTFISGMNPRLLDTLVQDCSRCYAMASLSFTRPDVPRRVFNNLFVHLKGMIPPAAETMPGAGDDVALDGNLHWDLVAPMASARKLLAFRKSKLFGESRLRYPGGWEKHSRVGDPRFRHFSPDARARNDYRLGVGSAARGVGVVLPTEWDDPFRPARRRRPDAGAVPCGKRFEPFGRPLRNDPSEFYAWLEGEEGPR